VTAISTVGDSDGEALGLSVGLPLGEALGIELGEVDGDTVAVHARAPWGAILPAPHAAHDTFPFAAWNQFDGHDAHALLPGDAWNHPVGQLAQSLAPVAPGVARNVPGGHGSIDRPPEGSNHMLRILALLGLYQGSPA